MKPNLFVIGAAKSGTTSLHYALNSHPEIFMCEPKEPAFFVPELEYLPKSVSWYLQLFGDCGDVRYAGESSTHYSKRPYFEGVYDRVHAFQPDARIIYLMRDPIDRAISHYWHNVYSTRPEFHEERPMLEAICKDPLYMQYGDYAMQIEPWIRRFGRDAVLPLVYEEMIANPENEIDRIFHWLGLTPFEGHAELEHRNARQTYRWESRGFGVLQWVRYTKAWNAISPWVPERLRRAASGLAVRRHCVEQEDSSAQVVQAVRPTARAQVAAVGDLLGRDFPAWKTTLGE